MSEHYFVGAYWGPRQETARACAQRSELFLRLLAECDPSFAQWYRVGKKAPPGLPGHPIQSVDDLERLMLSGRNRSSVGRKVLEDLGFLTGVFNARKEDTRLEFHCGAYYPEGHNYCLLEPPRDGPVHERLLSAPVLARIVTSLVTAWDPNFVTASSLEMLRLVEGPERETRVGWLTYVSRRLGTVPPLPAPVRIEPVGTQGWLLTLSPERMTAASPEHVALTARVRELLDRAGLIARPHAPREPS
ncbi:Imm52 family immunity protein [Archangium primigenium]|uniref:Imm52 family immunity protein n=1 Tax=[Archangium] primigenium TaxID=2792470 RepID=UPI00195CE172|nr:Imm52 family immunity protein [Archangium primigenium]MBM7112512.1 immunity 52 family protein [Archangium primigenium]